MYVIWDVVAQEGIKQPVLHKCEMLCVCEICKLLLWFSFLVCVCVFVCVGSDWEREETAESEGGVEEGS